MTAQLIARISLDDADHEIFARLSGDRNPAHTDPLAARRSFFGRTVVHGIHCVLASLEAIFDNLAEQRKGLLNGGLVGRFIKPVYPGEHFEIFVDDPTAENLHISVRKGEINLAEITLLAGRAPPVSLPCEEAPANLAVPVDRPLEELTGNSGKVEICDETDAVRGNFPHCCSVLGLTRVREIMALSQIIGMQCPGRHAVFTGFSLQFSEFKENPGLSYSVKQIVVPVRLVQLTVSGRTLGGQLDAFHLPPPPPVSFASLTRRLSPESLKEQVVFVIGGSRGLGEAVAKIFAAAGAEVVVTFRVGSAEAEKVAAEITEGGGRCHALHFDIASPEAGLEKWPSNLPAPTTLFYMATPKIFGKRGSGFDSDLFQSFEAMYVEGFTSTCKAVLERFNSPLDVFYPSSVAIDEDGPDLAEYRKAKRRGEKICQELDEQSPLLSIQIARLPRLSTDQTINFAGLSGSDPIEALLPIAAEISHVSLDDLLKETGTA